MHTNIGYMLHFSITTEITLRDTNSNEIVKCSKMTFKAYNLSESNAS